MAQEIAREYPAQPQRILAARIAAVGVGGAGTNAINHMIKVGVSGVEFIAMNTDAQALELALSPARVRLGEKVTHGLGAGGNPLVGQQAAEESYDLIRERLSGVDMVFITAGMGGGTGTGASPLVAQAAREVGALSVAVVTSPFAFERRRKQIAEKGIEALREVVDALILVPNERLMEMNPVDLGAFEAYRLADDVLRQGIQGISDLITIPGLINLDFADIRAIMTDTGSALMAMSHASGERRAEQAAQGALSNPLLDIDMSGARGVIFNITGSDDLAMSEVHEIAEAIAAAAHADANIIFGSVYDPTLAGTIKLTVVATGFEPRVVHPDLPVIIGAHQSPVQSSSFSGRGQQLAQKSQPGPMAEPAQVTIGPKKPSTGAVAENNVPKALRQPASTPRHADNLDQIDRRDGEPERRGSDEEAEEAVQLHRLEELRARRRRALSSDQEEEYVAGEGSSSDRPHQSWKRLFARHKDIF